MQEELRNYHQLRRATTVAMLTMAAVLIVGAAYPLVGVPPQAIAQLTGGGNGNVLLSQ